MDEAMFQNSAPGSLVPIRGVDPRTGAWTHHAFVPDPLPETMPDLRPRTFLAVADARAALAALDSTARQLPNPGLLRVPALRREAQSTSALEGTYAPLVEVLTADEDDPSTAEQREILNYVWMANYGFAHVAQGRPLTVSFLTDLQGLLMRGMPLESVSGRLRDEQVVVGRRVDAVPGASAIDAARFVPAPQGIALQTGVRDLIDWMRREHVGKIDPVVAAAMSHYQLETLHPFRDGNGRIGRYLIVLYLQLSGVLGEPTLTVSPWFEARRVEYYDRLLAVSTNGAWDEFVRFFAQGLQNAADLTREAIVALVAVQAQLKEQLRSSNLRADSAHSLVDLAVANPSFTVRKVESELGVSYGRANRLVAQLVDLGILAPVEPSSYRRRFSAPAVLDVLLR